MRYIRANEDRTRLFDENEVCIMCDKQDKKCGAECAAFNTGDANKLYYCWSRTLGKIVEEK